jgi:hypothetical protein
MTAQESDQKNTSEDDDYDVIVKRVHAVHVGALKDAAALKAPIAVRNC